MLTRIIGKGPAVTAINASDVYYDPYNVNMNADPYPVYWSCSGMPNSRGIHEWARA
jgi:hypothetical protein